MRYPKHIILDLKSSRVVGPYSDWETEFMSAMNLPLVTGIRRYPLNKLARRQFHSLTADAPLSSNNPLVKTLTRPLFDIHFIRKEQLYTKLKYSRCPQYDIVSGGFAAMFAGFIGFLISEKFGIELVDSGDFYNALMYAVFITLSARPLIRIYSKDETLYHPFSLKYAASFFRDVSMLLLTATKRFLRKAFRRFL